MGLRIRTNVASLNGQRQMAKSTRELTDSSSKLASGERINKAADDAAGLAISENLRADVRSLQVARRNANDAVSLVQTAEGGLVETSNILIRLRELAIQAASDTIGNTERGFIDKEFVALKEEIDRIANSTDWNGNLLLAGNADVPEELRKGGNSFPYEIQVGKDYYPELDGEGAPDPVNLIRIDLSDFNAYTTGEHSLDIGRGEEGIRATSRENAQNSISRLDHALGRVAEFRAYLGSLQNRFESTINNLGVQIENLHASRSRIRDTDFAAETARYTQSKILQQSGAAVLSQANAAPQIALTLLNSL